jgi:hypothetical protein
MTADSGPAIARLPLVVELSKNESSGDESSRDRCEKQDEPSAAQRGRLE